MCRYGTGMGQKVNPHGCRVGVIHDFSKEREIAEIKRTRALLLAHYAVNPKIENFNDLKSSHNPSFMKRLQRWQK